MRPSLKQKLFFKPKYFFSIWKLDSTQSFWILESLEFYNTWFPKANLKYSTLYWYTLFFWGSENDSVAAGWLSLYAAICCLASMLASSIFETRLCWHHLFAQAIKQSQPPPPAVASHHPASFFKIVVQAAAAPTILENNRASGHSVAAYSKLNT